MTTITIISNQFDKHTERLLIAMLNPKSSYHYNKYLHEFESRKISKYAYPITANKNWQQQLDELNKFDNWQVFCENKKLDLSNKKLTSIPSELGNLSSLQKLWLHNNQLQSIPSELGSTNKYNQK